MKIIIMRHSKVKYLWKKWYTSDEFDKACKEYDRSFVEHTEQNHPDFNYKNIFYTFAPPNGAFHLCEISIVNNG
mgnify:CR=1 FL=1